MCLMFPLCPKWEKNDHAKTKNSEKQLDLENPGTRNIDADRNTSSPPSKKNHHSFLCKMKQQSTNVFQLLATDNLMDKVN